MEHSMSPYGSRGCRGAEVNIKNVLFIAKQQNTEHYNLFQGEGEVNFIAMSHVDWGMKDMAMVFGVFMPGCLKSMAEELQRT